ASLLAAFLRRPGELLSRDELLRLVWEIEFDPGSNVVDVYVAALRRKLRPDLIETVRGRRYRLRSRAMAAVAQWGRRCSCSSPQRSSRLRSYCACCSSAHQAGRRHRSRSTGSATL